MLNFFFKKIDYPHLREVASFEIEEKVNANWMPGLVCKFEIQNIISLEGNIEFMGEVPFAVYFDFERKPGKKNFIFDEDSTLYPVSYSFVVAFHPDLNLEKIFVVRDFNQTFDQLNDMGYLASKMLHYFDSIMARQRRDCAKEVFKKKEKYVISKMFPCKLKFLIDILKKWLGEKFFQRFNELDLFSKQRFKSENLIC